MMMKEDLSDILGRWKESQAKECRYLLKAEKGNKTNSPLESPEGMHPIDTLILASQTLFGLLTSRTMRKYTCIVLSY